MIRNVIFDLDGTLLDTLSDLTGAVNASLDLCGHPHRTEEEVRHMVGHGNRNLMKCAIPEGENDPRFEEMFLYFRKYYLEHSEVRTAPYPGIDGMLSDLSTAGIKTAIVSNKLGNVVESLRNTFFPKIDIAIGGEDGRPLKPDPDMLFRAMDRLGATKEDTVYVGDSEGDITTSQRAGIPCVCVLWGFRSREELEGAGGEIFAEDTAELTAYLLNN